jgi:hypothetical protein
MAYIGVNAWFDPAQRPKIKAVFGNRRNFQRFCWIADNLEHALWERGLAIQCGP